MKTPYLSFFTYNIFIQLIETKNSKVLLFHLILMQSKGDKSEKFHVKQDFWIMRLESL